MSKDKVTPYLQKLRVLGADLQLVVQEDDTSQMIFVAESPGKHDSHLVLIPKETTELPYAYINKMHGHIKVIGGLGLTSTLRMFEACFAKSIDLTDFDTENVTNMSKMFRACCSDILGLEYLNTSKVTNMRNMFTMCKQSTLDLSSFDTSNVEHMGGMFYEYEGNIKTSDKKILDQLKIDREPTIDIAPIVI